MKLFWWWSRSSHQAEEVRAAKDEIEANRHEIEENRREIEATKPIVDEAVRRTNERYVARERETRRAQLEVALIRDLEGAWKD
jgi:hypothetical protein